MDVIALDQRLAAVASLVRPGSRVADVGADHGYLLAHLLLCGTASFGYACDIHPKPLEKAEQTLEEHGLLSRSRLLLGDGLRNLSPDEVDDVVIAGMGGDTILHILDEACWKDPEKRFILQPMTKAHQLREGLYRRGYEIITERAAMVKGFIYTAMQVRWCGREKAVDELFAWVGLLPQAQGDEAVAYLLQQEKRVRTIGAGMEKSNTNSKDYKKYYDLAGEICRIRREMEEKR